MTIHTHIVGPDLEHCRDCGLPIPPLRMDFAHTQPPYPLKQGESVGVIESVTVPHNSYRIGRHDSNERCRSEK